MTLIALASIKGSPGVTTAATALAALVALADTSPEAAKVLDETALYLGAGLADLINLYSPDQIILGGWAGLLLGHHLLPAIRASAREHALAHPFAETTITVGRLGPDAVARGAATLPIQAFLNGTAVPAATFSTARASARAPSRSSCSARLSGVSRRRMGTSDVSTTSPVSKPESTKCTVTPAVWAPS